MKKAKYQIRVMRDEVW